MRTNNMRIAIFAFLMLVCSSYIAFGAGAPTTGGNNVGGFCGFLFSNSGSVGAGGTYPNGLTPSEYNWSNYSSMLGIALVIVLAMLVLMGLVYGIGRAFSLPSFMDFAKTEYLESVANIILILFIAGGLTAVFTIMLFISNVASVGISSLPSNSVTSQPTAAVTTAAQMYENVCSHAAGNIAGTLGNMVVLYGDEIFISTLWQVTVNIAPNYEGLIPWTPGFSFNPFAGYIVLSQAIGVINGVIIFILLANLAVIFFLFIIFYLFPVFLFVGILLRTFPWTRAAGGAFLSLFIAFYIIFPALLYPFTLASNSQTLSSIQSNQPNINSWSGFWTFANSNLELLLPGAGTLAGGYENSAYGIISTSIGISEGTMLQMIGFIISFIICYDMLESLSDLLGAPSVTSGGLFRKLI